MTDLREVLLAIAKQIFADNPEDSDMWSSVTYQGVVFDVNVYGHEFTDDSKFKACAYIVFNGLVDISCGINLGEIK